MREHIVSVQNARVLKVESIAAFLKPHPFKHVYSGLNLHNHLLKATSQKGLNTRNMFNQEATRVWGSAVVSFSHFLTDLHSQTGTSKNDFWLFRYFSADQLHRRKKKMMHVRLMDGDNNMFA